MLTATMPANLLEITKKVMHNPAHVVVKIDPENPKGVKQFNIDIEKEEQKFETLCSLDSFINISRAVIFCNTRQKVDWLTEKMRGIGVSVTSMVRICLFSFSCLAHSETSLAS
jgi:superfamily II DNA/RNA helicase